LFLVTLFTYTPYLILSSNIRSLYEYQGNRLHVDKVHLTYASYVHSLLPYLNHDIYYSSRVKCVNTTSPSTRLKQAACLFCIRTMSFAILLISNIIIGGVMNTSLLGGFLVNVLSFSASDNSFSIRAVVYIILYGCKQFIYFLYCLLFITLERISKRYSFAIFGRLIIFT